MLMIILSKLELLKVCAIQGTSGKDYHGYLTRVLERIVVLLVVYDGVGWGGVQGPSHFVLGYSKYSWCCLQVSQFLHFYPHF